MRIVAGSLRGKTIDAPDGLGTRPTTDRVREALFSSLFSLRGGFEGAIVLDAFAGSGALGLEALSRGAENCTFYERDTKAARVLRKNVDACGVGPSKASVVQRDVMQAPPSAPFAANISSAPGIGRAAFDLVFLDPPYAYDPAQVLNMVTQLRESGALAADAIVVYEHALDSKAQVANAAEAFGFELRAQKKYGKTAISTLLA